MQHSFCMHYFYYHHYYYLFLFCPSKLSLFQPAFFLIVSPIPLEGRVNKQLCGAQLLARLNHNTPPNYLICLMKKVLNNIICLNGHKLQSCGISSCQISFGIFLRSYLTLQTLLSSLVFSLISGRKGFEKSVTRCVGRLLTFFKISLKFPSFKIPKKKDLGEAQVILSKPPDLCVIRQIR